METKINRSVPIREFLKDDEMAFCVDGESLFTLDPSDITKLLESHNWKFYGYHKRVEKEDGNPIEIYVDVYKGDLENYLLVEYELGGCRKNIENGSIWITGFRINTYGMLIERNGRGMTINLRRFVPSYSKNNFDKIIRKIKEYTLQKSKENEFIYS